MSRGSRRGSHWQYTAGVVVALVDVQSGHWFVIGASLALPRAGVFLVLSIDVCVASRWRCADRLVIELALCDGIDISGNLALEVAGGDGEFSSRPFCSSFCMQGIVGVAAALSCAGHEFGVVALEIMILEVPKCPPFRPADRLRRFC